MKEVITGDGIPKGPLPFSPAIKAGGFVFVSGQASVDLEGKIVTDTFEGEMRRSMDNLRKILALAGLDFSNVVQVKSYVGVPEYLAEYNTIYREYFSEPYPARSTIVNCLGTALKFEIDVIAYAG